MTAEPQPDDPGRAVVAQMIVAGQLRSLLPLAKNGSLTTEQWWARCEPYWRADPAYLANLEDKATKHGKQWVRENMAAIHGYWKNTLQLIHLSWLTPQDWDDF